MNLVIKKSKFYQGIFLLMIVVLTFERVYTPQGVKTGTYNAIIFPIITALILIYSFINTKWTDRVKILTFIACLGIVISLLFIGNNYREGVRYFLLVLLTASMIQIEPWDFLGFYRLVILVGLGFTIYDIFQGVERTTGFLVSSPTLYSLIILTAITYLSYLSRHIIIDNALIILGLLIIFHTGSRSTLLAGILICGFKYIKIILKKNNIIFKYLGVIILMIGIGVFTLSVKGVFTGSIGIRDNASSSNLTRINFIQRLLDNLTMEPTSFISGMGPGFSYSFTSSISGIKVPLHQDFIAILCDFGIFGILITMMFFLFSRYRWPWQGWVLLTVGSFHNLIFSPICVILIMLTSSSIALQNNKIRVLNDKSKNSNGDGLKKI